jgi:phosphopantothenoylcysteine decarboxylase
MLIAPLSANTLAKMAHGQCDNLLTCVARAWDFAHPLIVAPAMNTLMWTHPFTEQHLSTLRSLGVVVIPPISKVLACGDIGAGAMASVDEIVIAVRANSVAKTSIKIDPAQQQPPTTSVSEAVSAPQ